MPGLAPTSYRDLINSTFPKVRKPFSETLRDSHQALTRLTYGGDTLPFTGTSFEIPVRIAAGGGGVFVNLYQGTPAVLLDGLIRYQVTPQFYVNKNTVFDEKEQGLNSGQEAVVPLMEMKESMTQEAIANDMEDILGNVPSSASDTKRFLGPLVWFPATKVGTTDYVGGHNGDTLTRQDTSTTTTIGSVDRSTAQNLRVRSWQGNYQTVDNTLLKTIRRAAYDCNFGVIQGLNGEAPTMSNVRILCPKSVAQDLEDMVNRGPDDLNGELIQFKMPRIRGMPIEPVSVYDRLTILPIQGLNLSKWKGLVVKSKWMAKAKAINMENTHDVWIVPVDCHGNAIPTDIRSGGWTISKPR